MCMYILALERSQESLGGGETFPAHLDATAKPRSPPRRLSLSSARAGVAARLAARLLGSSYSAAPVAGNSRQRQQDRHGHFAVFAGFKLARIERVVKPLKVIPRPLAESARKLERATCWVYGAQETTSGKYNGDDRGNNLLWCCACGGAACCC